MKHTNEDTNFLLSCIRNRENGLLYFLEKYVENPHKFTADVFRIHKNEFL